MGRVGVPWWFSVLEEDIGRSMAREDIFECVHVEIDADAVDHFHLGDPGVLVHHHQDLLAVWCGALLVSALEFLGSCGGGVWL